MNQRTAKALYKKLIKNARKIEPKEKRPKGYEKHHIVPRSCGGDDSKENTIILTYEMHFTAHKLLKYFYKKGSEEWRKMNCAFWMMCSTKRGKRFLTKEEYAEAKRERWEIKDTPEIRKKRSDAAKIAQKKRYSDPEQRLLTSIRTKEGMARPEIKQKLINNRVGKKTPEETRLKQSQANLGKKKSEETKRRIGLAKAMKINQYDKITGKFIATYESMAEVERQFGISTGSISLCCRSILKTAGGFIWKYADKL
jgi:hypothetical protein